MMPVHFPAGDLARAIVHDPDSDWDGVIELVLSNRDRNGHKRRVASVEISADEYFGRGSHGAPMRGDQLIGMIERLRSRK